MKLIEVMATRTLRHEGAWHGPGTRLTMTEAEAEARKAGGEVRDAPPAKAKAGKKKGGGKGTSAKDPGGKPAGDAPPDASGGEGAA
ncbi:MAG: hypothetical protein IH626_05400 [Rhodospirillales bacterium]|nr:hypothetical protein [Rhodospirillales bacterium]